MGVSKSKLYFVLNGADESPRDLELVDGEPRDRRNPDEERRGPLPSCERRRLPLRATEEPSREHETARRPQHRAAYDVDHEMVAVVDARESGGERSEVKKGRGR